ncbi:hypothetical protein C6A88_04415, partial [Mycolicibacterium austroafricanum]
MTTRPKTGTRRWPRALSATPPRTPASTRSSTTNTKTSKTNTRTPKANTRTSTTHRSRGTPRKPICAWPNRSATPGAGA